MTLYLFKVTLRGTGETEDEAWTNAVEAFTNDPGDPDETEEELNYCPGCGNTYSDLTELTSISDHSLCWNCHHEKMTGITPPLQKER
jgi:protein-arginine kinase activator protein McsA